MEADKKLENLFKTNLEVKFMYLDVLKQIASINSYDDCRRIMKRTIMESLEKKVDYLIQEKFNDGSLFFRSGRIEIGVQPISATDILLDASEAEKRSGVFDENYLANKSNRTKEAIGIALKKIDLNIKSNIGRGLRGISYISNEEIREELSLILRKHGYTVDSHLLGNDRVKFTINW